MGVKGMKKLITGLIALVILITGQTVFADSPTQTVPIAADIPQMLDLELHIYTIDASAPPTMNPFSYPEAIPAAMNFGTLTFADTPQDNNHVWRSSVYFTAILVARTSGRPYKITQTCAGIVNGANNLNKNVLMTPGYQAEDLLNKNDPNSKQGPMPGTQNTAKAFAVGANREIYNSDPLGISRIIRCYYGLATGNPADNEPSGSSPVTADALAGNYSGSVTFSVVLK